MGVFHLSRTTSSLMLFMSIGLFFSFRARAGTYWRDVQVLKQLKNSVDPNSVSPGSCLSSWDFGADPCDSLFSDKFTCGFRCDSVVSGASRITELTLDQAGYSGSLSSVSWALPYLQTLDLAGNYFSGSIPDSFSNLVQLNRLSLSRNSLSGPITESLSSLANLEELSLDNNALEGSVPTSLNSLSKLNRLEIQSNNLSGEFPVLNRLSSLLYLDASNNEISGEAPSQFPPSLIQLSMRNNALAGRVPENLQLLSSLQVLDLSHNRLSGSVPHTLFSHPSLQQLTLSFNGLDSVQATPTAALWESELIALDLSNNRIRGFLPMFLAMMPKLSALAMENNQLSGMIPTEYALKAALPGSGVSRFERLLLGGNYLFGPIPGPLVGLRPDDSVNVSLVDNCLYRCPPSFFFCQGGEQKSSTECKNFGPIIP